MIKIEKSTIEFLQELSKNNNREWMLENKSKYQTAKENFRVFMNHVGLEISEFDDSITDPEKDIYIFRLNRDTRFSKDKSPYKTNFGGFVSKGGRKALNPGYYLHIQPGNSFIGGGIYMPDPKKLNSIREKIYKNFDSFKEIIENKDFKQAFGELSMGEEKLSRVPTGFDKNHPAAEVIKNKHFVVGRQFTDDIVMSSEFLNIIVGLYKLQKPLHVFLSV